MGEARFGCFVCPWEAGHDVRFVSFVSGATKQIHAASVRSGLRATVSEESNSLAFTTNLASVPVRLRRTGTEVRFVSFVSGATKQSRLDSVAFVVVR